MFGIFLPSISEAQEVSLLYKIKGGKELRQSANLQNFRGHKILEIDKNTIPQDAESVEITADFAKAKAGETGYIVMPNGELCEFKERPNAMFTDHRPTMPISGMKKGDSAFLVIAEGLQFEWRPLITLKNGVYTLSQIYSFKRYKPYENIVLNFYFYKGENANYNSMAKTFREIQLERKIVTPLKERVKNNPELEYITQATELRIRQAWKPAPSPVADQNLQNEPALIVKMTFDRVGELIDAMKAEKIDKAQICLVGWNRMGHDGRYPQIFPVEPQLGGEERLRALIKKTQSYGYQIVAHTNPTSAYPVSELWNTSYVAKTADNKPWERPIKQPWSGGRSYFMCMKTAYEMFAKSDFPRIRELGFKGVYYMDVLSVVPPQICYDPNHYTNASDSAKYVNKILALARKTFGGAQSEGGFAHSAGNLDYALYASLKNLFGKYASVNHSKIIDKQIPLWQLVYSGIILNNPSVDLVNYAVKDKKLAIKLAECNGRPLLYINSAFFEKGKKSNWMGDEDLKCDMTSDLTPIIKALKQAQAYMKEFAPLQYEFMISHEELASEVVKCTYSNGTEVVCNYSDNPFTYKGETVSALNYKIFKK